MSTSDTWTKGQIPNMQLVDLEREPPQVCISTGRERQETGHGNANIDLLRERVLFIFNSKPKETKAKKPDSQPHEANSPPKDITPHEESGESHIESSQPEPEPQACKEQKDEKDVKEPDTPKPEKKYFCSECRKPTNKTQAEKSFAEYIKTLCSDCYNKAGNAKYQAEKESAQDPQVSKPSEQIEKIEEPKKDIRLPDVVNRQQHPAKPDAMLPVRSYSPQGSIVKGFVPRLAEIGKIKIGRKGTNTTQSGFRLPEKFDHFEVVSILKDEHGNFIPDPIMAELGENPKSLEVMLLYNDPTLNFTTRYNEYKGGKCQCQGDGQTAHTIDGNEIACNPETCAKFKDKKCKLNGILSVILTKSPRLGGVYKFRTTSFNSVRSILSSLFFIRSLTGGVLAMIPLKMTVSPMQVQPVGIAKAQTIYVVNLEFAGTAQDLLKKTVEVSQYQQIMRAQIQELEATAKLSLKEAESKEEIDDAVAEFYVETAQQEAKK